MASAIKIFYNCYRYPFKIRIPVKISNPAIIISTVILNFVFPKNFLIWEPKRAQMEMQGKQTKKAVIHIKGTAKKIFVF